MAKEIEQIPSKYQKRIFKEVVETNNSICANSTAGSGKTWTLVKILDLIPKNQDTIFLAFNVHTAENLKLKMPNRPKNIEISTLHGFGSRVLYTHYGKLPVVENKSFKACLSRYKVWQEKGEVKEIKWTYCDRVGQIVNMMKLTMTPPEQVEVEVLAGKYSIMTIGYEIEHAIEIYEMELKSMKTIDFNDMLFLPAIKNNKMKRFDTILVDEAQDLSKAAATMVKKMLKPTGRLIIVGDRNQSIYGFAGADFTSFDNLKKIVPGTVELPLSISYRCSKAVVKHAQKLVPEMEYHPDAPEGFVGVGSWEDIGCGDMVLCRNLKPLVILLLDLVDKDIKANIKGREISKSMVNMIEKTKQKTITSLIAHLKVDKVKLKNKLMKRGVFKPEAHNSMRELTERIEIIKILGKRTGSVKVLKEMIVSIFLDTNFPGTILSTGHKAKGLEAENVHILFKELIPSKYAVTQSDFDQEKNLDFVMRTRAKLNLYYIDDYIIEDKTENE